MVACGVDGWIALAASAMAGGVGLRLRIQVREVLASLGGDDCRDLVVLI